MPKSPDRPATMDRTSSWSGTARGWHVPPTPAEERPPTDRDWSTADLPATPQRYYLIPAERWTEAPAVLKTLGADFGVDLVAYKRRIGRYLLWRAGPAKGGDARYMAIAAD